MKAAAEHWEQTDKAEFNKSRRHNSGIFPLHIFSYISHNGEFKDILVAWTVHIDTSEGLGVVRMT